MLSTADIIVITKGDMVSQAEREVFHQQVQTINPAAKVIEINGLTGRGSLRLKNEILKSRPLETITGQTLSCPMPSAVCSYCAGEMIVGSTSQMGIFKKVDFGRAE
jgi:hypothetical protein